MKRGIGSQSLDPLWCLAKTYESCETNLFMFRANTCQQETVIFFIARDLSHTEELALHAPQVMLPLCSNPTVGLMSFDHWLVPMSNLVISHQGRLWL